MGLQHETENPTDAVELASNTDSKKYIVVKNHVREITNLVENNESNNSEEQSNVIKGGQKNKKRKKSGKHSSSEDQFISGEINNISGSDLEELRAVYKKCKSVLNKIETKYGHLLNVEEDISSPTLFCDHSSFVCTCTLNNKVVFNEEGYSTQLNANSLEHHICSNRLKKNRYTYENIQIEHESICILPDTIQELGVMLTDTSIPNYLRNRIIEKIKMLKQGNMNMIRFDKQLLIQKLKTDPDEILDFKGTNISSLEGYPTSPREK